MTPLRRRWLSGLLAALLLLLLLVIVSLDDLFRAEPPERVVLTEVQIYEPPPPPPPPPIDQREGGSSGPAVTLIRRDEPIVLETMDLEVQLAAGELGNLGAGGWGFGDGAGAALELVNLSELDEVPIVLYAPPVVYPKEAIERRIDEFEVRIHVVIDEGGRTYPVRIVESPFPALARDFEDYASQVVFSPPKRLGIPVRTEYIWPVLIKRDLSRR